MGSAWQWLYSPCPCRLQPPAPTPIDDPNVPKGVDVQARGPVHEAFANPTAESNDTPFVQKRPPAPIEEMPPAEKPEGNVSWIGGYWHYDEDRQDYLWVSGCWRTLPPGRQWIGGYWREQDSQPVPGNGCPAFGPPGLRNKPRRPPRSLTTQRPPRRRKWHRPARAGRQ